MGRIYLRNELDEDVRVLQIAAELNLTALHTVGALWKLWSHADAHSHNGRMCNASSAVIDKLVQIPGFGAAVEKVGWLVVDESGVTLPRYAEHNGKSQKVRRQARLRVQRWRQRNAHGNALRNANVTPRKRSVTPSSSASASASALKDIGAIAPGEKVTWLTPYADAWLSAYGGEMAAAPALKPLSKLRAVHADESLLPAWRRYLDSTDGQYASAARFAATFGKWSSGEDSDWDSAPHFWACGNAECPDGGHHESPNRAAMPNPRRCPHLAEVRHAG